MGSRFGLFWHGLFVSSRLQFGLCHNSGTHLGFGVSCAAGKFLLRLRNTEMKHDLDCFSQ